MFSILIVGMLTFEEIVGLHADGVEIEYKKLDPSRPLSGEYDPSTDVATIFLPAGSTENKHTTLLHLLIRARDERQGKREYKTEDEKDKFEQQVDEEAKETLLGNSYLVNYIIETWELPY